MATTTLSNLGSRLKILEKAIKERANAAAMEFAKAGIDSTHASTAVDTAKAISNWKISFGSSSPISSTQVEPYTFGERTPSFRSASAVAYAAIKLKKQGETLHVYNNVDYIEYLDEYHRRFSNMSGKLVVAGSNALQNYYKTTTLKY